MNYWDNLSMQDRAGIMKLFIDKGIYDLDTIRREYNMYAEGGDTNNSWTTADEAGFQEWRAYLPKNLRNTKDIVYDMRAAYKSGAQPQLYDDGYMDAVSVEQTEVFQAAEEFRNRLL